MDEPLQPAQSAFPMKYTMECGVLSNHAERKIWFPPENSDGPTVRVEHDSRIRWFGYFPRSRPSQSLIQFHSTPDPDRLLFCSPEATIVVLTNDPDTFIHLDFPCVQSVLPAPQHNLMVLINFTEVAFFDGHRIVWKSPRISFDGFDELAIEGELLKGLAWDAPTQDWLAFELNLRTRVLRGGTWNR